MHDTLLADVARIIAEVADTEVMPRWRNLGVGDIVEKTGPGDLVTIADKAAEHALSMRLAAYLPGSVVVGEEAVSADAAVLGRFAGSASVWVIDPIDGTAAFAAGDPDFTLMVALVEAGRPVAGWIAAPALETHSCGGPDRGVWVGRNVESLAPLPRPVIPASISEMVGLIGRRNITEERRAELLAKEAHFGALDGVLYAGIDYMRLAQGGAHFALYTKSEPWDHLPGLAIVSELGFVAAKLDGSPYRPGDNTGGLLVAPDAASLAAIRTALLS